MDILQMTSLSEYNSLLSLVNLNNDQIQKIAQYPHRSLLSLCDDVTFYDKNKIKEIEDQNIWYLINSINLIFGLASNEQQKLFNSNLTKEPLRTAVFLAQQETNPKYRFITFAETACKILLSYGGKPGIFLDPIDVKISGTMPRNFFKSRQSIGDRWFNEFVDNKLTVLRLAYINISPEKAYSIFLKSIAYSLYNFTPYRYHIQFCKDENEALHRILNIFIKTVENIKK